MAPFREIPGDALLGPLRNRDRIAVVVKAVVRAADAWGLTNTEGAALFDAPRPLGAA